VPLLARRPICVASTAFRDYEASPSVPALGEPTILKSGFAIRTQRLMSSVTRQSRGLCSIIWHSSKSVARIRCGSSEDESRLSTAIGDVDPLVPFASRCGSHRRRGLSKILDHQDFNAPGNFVVDLANYTPASAENRYLSAARYLSPGLLSRFEPVARAQLKQVVTNRISQFFAVDSEKVEGKDPLVVRFIGERLTYVGRTEKKAFSISSHAPACGKNSAKIRMA
jgi:hypothetical protein